MNNLDDVLHWAMTFIGLQLGDGSPVWLHPLLHVVLIAMPLALGFLAVALTVTGIRRRLRNRHMARPGPDGLLYLPTNVFRYIISYSRNEQVGLVLLGLLSMPVLYATLELPKLIINSALADEHVPASFIGYDISQIEHLFILCGIFLIAVIANGFLKYIMNVFKGRVGERLLRRLRLLIVRLWRRGHGPTRRSEVIPLVAQEVEPIGGFASDAFSLPMFQGGTFITILVFMFAQEPVLGAAALVLLPVQLLIIPKLQRRLNRLSRQRVAELRALGGVLGEQAAKVERESTDLILAAGSLRKIETIRINIHRAKFFMKALNNFLTALTPIFFYSIGGFLVIKGSLTLGALVAVLAAYKDFSAPLKELFGYYQSMEDVRIRYEEVRRFLLLGDAMHRADRL